jgi:hypothetical protein
VSYLAPFAARYAFAWDSRSVAASCALCHTKMPSGRKKGLGLDVGNS